MDKAKILLISSFVGAFCCFAFSISLLLVAGKPFAISQQGVGYEGKGQQHLWTVNYGTTCQGLFSAFAYIGLVVYHYQAYKQPTSEKFTKLSGMTIFATIMLLQAAIAYGNEALTANELFENSSEDHKNAKFDPESYTIVENCGGCAGTTCPEGTQCAAAWTCAGSDCPTTIGIEANPLHLRTYRPNTKITKPANAAVTFGVFMFLLSIFQVFFLSKHQQEIAGGAPEGGAGGGNYSAPAAAESKPAAAGEGYQRL